MRGGVEAVRRGPVVAPVRLALELAVHAALVDLQLLLRFALLFLFNVVAGDSCTIEDDQFDSRLHVDDGEALRQKHIELNEAWDCSWDARLSRTGPYGKIAGVVVNIIRCKRTMIQTPKRQMPQTVD